MWKQWSVTALGMKKLKQYSIRLPQLIVLLDYTLHQEFAKVIGHGLFLSPTGCENHFLPKDQLLEVQNYWLKHFFNNSGKGTKIDRLKDTYSVNITLVSKQIQCISLNGIL
jgi:hypothetical protein